MSLLWRISTMLPTSWLRNSRSCEMTRMAPGYALQVILEPEQGFEVEVVGRFVEQQQVGFLGEQPGQVGAHDPAAAHFAGRPVEILFAETEAGEDLLGLGFQAIAAEFVEAVVDIVVDFLRVQGLRPDDRLPRP